MSRKALNTLADVLRDHPDDLVIQIDRSDARSIVKEEAVMRDLAEALALRLVALSGGDNDDIAALRRLTGSHAVPDSEASLQA